MTILDRLHTPRPDSLNLLLALLLITPVTLAHASPPDQTWLAGVYDQADFDDVVGLLTSALEATDSTTAPEVGPCLAVAPKLGVSARCIRKRSSLCGISRRSHLAAGSSRVVSSSSRTSNPSYGQEKGGRK